MKKFIAIFLMVILVFPLIPVGEAYAWSYNGVTYPNPITDGNPMNLRSAPSASADKIGQVDMFEAISILGQEGNFYQVRTICTDYQTRTGYLSANYVRYISKQSSGYSASEMLIMRSFPDNSSYVKRSIQPSVNFDIYFEASGYYYVNCGQDSGFVKGSAVTKGTYVEQCKHSFGAVKYESQHPHKGYQVCTKCNETFHTGDVQKLSECQQCYPKDQSGTGNLGDQTWEQDTTKPGVTPPQEPEKPAVPPQEPIDSTSKAGITEPVAQNPSYDTVIAQSLIFKAGSTSAMNKGKKVQMDAPVLIRDNRSCVPIRYVGEWFGGTIGWNNTKNCAELMLDGKTIDFYLGRNQVVVDGKAITVDAAPFLESNRTYVSIRTVTDILGKHVYYKDNKSPVIITDINMTDEYGKQMIDQAANKLDLAEASSLRLEDFSFPDTIEYKNRHQFSGCIKSNYPIQNVYIRVASGDGKVEAAKVFQPNSTSFNLSEITNSIYTEGLPEGKATIQIEARDQKEKKILFEKTFDIAAASKLRLENFSFPDTITYKNRYQFSGSVESNYTIQTVYVRVASSDGKVEAAKVFQPNSTSYKLSEITNSIYTEGLPEGRTTIQIEARDQKGKKTLFNKEFEIKSGAQGSLAWPLPGNSYITTIFNCANPTCHSNGSKCAWCKRSHGNHKAIDIAATKGTAVKAAESGTIVAAGYHEGGGGYGNAIVIDHGNGIKTQYSHLSRIDVNKGQSVQRGQTIGGTGDSDSAGSFHLDFKVIKDNTAVDPLQYVQVPSDARTETVCDRAAVNAAKTK